MEGQALKVKIKRNGGAQLEMISTVRVVMIENDKRLEDASRDTSNISQSWYKEEG